MNQMNFSVSNRLKKLFLRFKATFKTKTILKINQSQMKIFKSLAILFLFLSFISCLPDQSDNGCYEISGTPTIAVQGPTASTVGVPVNLDVTYTVINTCDTFYLFFEENTEGVKEITVNVRYDGCNCEEEITDRIRQYEFVSLEPGTFVLRFKTTNTTYIEHIIEVTE